MDLLQLRAVEPGIGGTLGGRRVIRRRDRTDLRARAAEPARKGEDLGGEFRPAGKTGSRHVKQAAQAPVLGSSSRFG